MPLVYPGFSLHKELELLVEVGLTATDALRAATVWPAEFLGLSESCGSIEVGKRADLVLLDDNPLRDIKNTQRIHAVILDGRLLDHGDLAELLRGRSPQSPADGRDELNRIKRSQANNSNNELDIATDGHG
jgi:adenine deaminase